MQHKRVQVAVAVHITERKIVATELLTALDETLIFRSAARPAPDRRREKRSGRHLYRHPKSPTAITCPFSSGARRLKVTGSVESEHVSQDPAELQLFVGDRPESTARCLHFVPLPISFVAQPVTSGWKSDLSTLFFILNPEAFARNVHSNVFAVALPGLCSNLNGLLG